jgi:ATP-dependent Clp protease ATP-binding subunit ClpC
MTADPATAHAVLTRAGEDARRLGYGYIGTEHVLLALLPPESGVAAEVLAELGVTREAVLATPCMGQGQLERREQGCLGLMPRLKQALEAAGRMAEGLGRPVPGGEHVLAGILTVRGAMAIEILRRLGVRPDDIRTLLAARLDADPERLVVTQRRRWRLPGWRQPR